MNQLEENKSYRFARRAGLLAILLISFPYWFNFVFSGPLLREPISLKAGSSISKDIFVIWGNEYEIYLDFQRNREIAGLADFVGHGVYGPDGSPINDGIPLDVEWTLSQGEEIIATNKGKSISGTGHYWGKENLGRKIGFFSSKPLSRYSFVARVSTTAKQFELAAPHIVIKHSFEFIKNASVIFLLIFILGAILGITALLVFGGAYYKLKRPSTKR